MGSTTAASTVLKVKIEPNQSTKITKAEVEAALAASAAYDAANEAKKQAEKLCDEKSLVIFSKALGINTYDDLKGMTPEEINEVFEERKDKGVVQYEKGADFKITYKNNGQRPQWAELFKQHVGGAKALEIKNATPPSYSYSIETA